MINPELIFKSFNYSLYEWYEPIGFYCGIYNNSHLLFTHDFWERNDKLTFNDILHIPTQNEMDYIVTKHPDLTDMYHSAHNIYNKHNVITLDYIYYRRSRRGRLISMLQSNRYSILSINRIYE